MTDPFDAVGLIAEAFTWVGFSLGALLFLFGLIPLALSKRWVQTEGVVVAGPPTGETYRWIDNDGEVQEAIADDMLPREPGDELTVYFDSWRPWRGRLDSPEHDGRALRVAGLILLGVGVFSVVVSIVLMFITPTG